MCGRLMSPAHETQSMREIRLLRGRLYEELEDTKEVIRICNSRRKDNIMAKRKRKNSDLQNTTQKTKDRATQTHLKMGLEAMNFCSTNFTHCVTLVANHAISHE